MKSVAKDDDGEYFCRAQNSEGFGQDGRPIYIETKGMIIAFIEYMYQK